MTHFMGQIDSSETERCAFFMMPGIPALNVPCRKIGEPGETGHYRCTLVYGYGMATGQL